MSGSRLRSHLSFLLGAVAIALLAACSGSGPSQTSSDSAFVFVTVDLATAGALTSNLDLPVTSTTVCARFQNTLKNPTVTAPTPLDDVQFTSYTVAITRFDGGPPPGPFTINTAFTVPAGSLAAGAAVGTPVTGNTRNVLVVVVPAGAKRQAPLHNPRPPLPLNTNAELIFQGRDNRGNRHEVRAGVSLVFLADDTQTTEPAGQTTCTN